MERTVTITVNGRAVEQAVPLEMLLIDILRDICALPSVRADCANAGTCGTCTVFLDGRAIKSCLKLAVHCDGREVTTLEGLGKPDRPHRLQTHLPAYHGIGCGRCTPGLIMVMAAYLKEKPAPTPHELRAALAGNTCACGNLDYLIEASLAAADRIVGRTPKPPREPEVVRDNSLPRGPVVSHVGTSPPRLADEYIVIGQGLPDLTDFEPILRAAPAVISRECTLDASARLIGLEPTAVRRANLVEYPDRRRAWDALIERVDLADFRCAQQLAWERGEYRGIGFACEAPAEEYPESGARRTLGMARTAEGVMVASPRAFDASEATGISQIVADILGVDPTAVNMVVNEELPAPDGEAEAPQVADAVRVLANALKDGEDGANTAFIDRPVRPDFMCHAVMLKVDAGSGRILPGTHHAVVVAAPAVNPRLVALADQSAIVRAMQAVLDRRTSDMEGEVADQLSMINVALARIVDIPPVSLLYQHPSGAEPSRLGAFRESAAPAAGAAFVNAVCDALRPFDAQSGDLPLRPEVILRNMR